MAEELGINREDVIVYMGDTHVSLFDVRNPRKPGDLRSGVGGQGGLPEKVRKILLGWASQMLETPVEHLAAEGGRIFVTENPERWVSIKEVAETAQTSGWGSAAAEASIRPNACPPHFTVCFAEVEVDIQTGQVKVLRAVTGADVGTPINLNSVEGQVAGGLHMGLGFALLEDTRFDPRTGKALNANFRDYKTLTALDMPSIGKMVADTFEPTGPFGAKGVGEGATNPVAASCRECDLQCGWGQN